jgi:tryptophan synthase alpha chain
VRSHTRTPLAIGFGISRPEHVAALKPYADACIVGGAIADLLESSPAETVEASLRAYIASLRAAC